MTFEEFLEQLATEYQNPKAGDADRNGNTRLAVLQYRHDLSSLKIQKLLIAAGVFVPVKAGSHFYEVQELWKTGKSAKEIVKITGLSTAAVNAFLPYEKGAMNLDKLGVEISDNAARKRKQRNGEDVKRQEAVAELRQQVSDDRFWDALTEHSGESFKTARGEKYSIEVADGTLKVEMRNEKQEFSKEAVLSVLHNALEVSAVNSLDGMSEQMLDQTEALHYVYPILSVFRVIDDDCKKYSVRRGSPTHIICSCCGRRTAQLFTVRSYSDLKRLEEKLDREQRAAMSEEEREKAEQAERAYRVQYEYEHGRKIEDVTKEREQKAAASKAVAEFNGEVRHLCELCAETIRMALDDGDMPVVSARADYKSLPTSLLEENINNSLVKVERAADRVGRRYGAEEIYYSSHGHLFVLSFRKDSENLFLCATEVHKLTKAGKIAAGSTNTDYEVKHDVRIDSSMDGKEMLVGLLELEDKIDDTVTNLSIEDGHLRDKGTIKPAYFGDDRGEFGFCIDGKEYTGDQMAQMFSRVEGWHIHYQVDDPSSPVLKRGEYLMPVHLGKNELVNETLELLNMFCRDGRFISQHDEKNFGKLFDGILRKLKLYHESNPRGYGKLAGMEVINKLIRVDETEQYQERVREIIR